MSATAEQPNAEDAPARGPQSLPHGETRISVVIPAFNRRDTVARAIDSALAQEPAPTEILVVDDGSTDGTAEVVTERFGDRVRLIRRANGGAAASRNHGVREASRGEWIAFLDSDDYWLPGYLDAMTRAIAATDGEADLYFGDLLRTPDEGGGRLWPRCGFSIGADHELVADGTDWGLLTRQPMMLQSSVVRRSRYLELGGMRDELRSRHDTHLFAALAIGRPICAVDVVGAQMTSDDTSGGRVTQAIGAATHDYWTETVAMYRHLLATHRALARPDRAELRTRVASAHLRLAKLAGVARPLRALGHVLAAGAASPRRLLLAIRRRG